ncbi:hypothetical protein [Streptomyces sp. NPDC056244]|uniref:hypothetical protein n=1 Tax=Streptomyces sp. NPDC056244 TaxID=3345762 RepID=UPI0035DD1D53
MASAARERLCDWVINKDAVWVHGDRITDGRVALDMRAIAGLDPAVVDRDGQWVIRKHSDPKWLGEEHPDLSEVLPPSGPGWSAVRWSAWSTAGARIGAVHGRPVAVHHEWLSRLQDGYRLEGSESHDILRIVSMEPRPALLPVRPDTPEPAVVGVMVPMTIEASETVLQAIVQDLCHRPPPGLRT